ncbi:MAG: phosphoribosylanthranilate isomerase [Planctomycetes bacterium]|nr:phosphoribosylanthranilate isomerase [Planctomycetota bacterium]
MTLVKICGLQTVGDARLCADLGAWAVGFVFHRPSPRFIEPEEAGRVAERLGGGVLLAGVFVDWPLDRLNAVVAEVGLDAVQLHGDESPEYAAAVEAPEVWKAFRVREGFDPAAVDAYGCCRRILLDAYHPSRPGGTGATFDWEIARAVQKRRPVILAGGLSPANIADALRAVEPEAVDVSSGVELQPGVKDPRKLGELFRSIREIGGGTAAPPRCGDPS